MSQSQGAASPGVRSPATYPGPGNTTRPRLWRWAGQACSWPPYLPEHEADRVHHCGLDDLSAREDAPGDRVGLQLGGVGDIFHPGGGGREQTWGADSCSPLTWSTQPCSPLHPPALQLCDQPQARKSEVILAFSALYPKRQSALLSVVCSLPLMFRLTRPLFAT